MSYHLRRAFFSSLIVYITCLISALYAILVALENSPWLPAASSEHGHHADGVISVVTSALTGLQMSIFRHLSIFELLAGDRTFSGTWNSSRTPKFCYPASWNRVLTQLVTGHTLCTKPHSSGLLDLVWTWSFLYLPQLCFIWFNCGSNLPNWPDREVCHCISYKRCHRFMILT